MIIGQDFANALTDVPTQMLIAPVLPTMVSDRAYAVGEQFIVNSVLYKITQAVSAADVPLVVGTNCALADTVTEQIVSMKGALSGTTTNYQVSAQGVVRPLLDSTELPAEDYIVLGGHVTSGSTGILLPYITTMGNWRFRLLDTTSFIVITSQPTISFKFYYKKTTDI